MLGELQSPAVWKHHDLSLSPSKRPLQPHMSARVPCLHEERVYLVSLHVRLPFTASGSAAPLVCTEVICTGKGRGDYGWERRPGAGLQACPSPPSVCLSRSSTEARGASSGDERICLSVTEPAERMEWIWMGGAGAGETLQRLHRGRSRETEVERTSVWLETGERDHQVKTTRSQHCIRPRRATGNRKCVRLAERARLQKENTNR